MQSYEKDLAAEEYVNRVSHDLREKYTIDPNQFKTRNVKRGLRNVDGTGVLAGVTNIGSVQGYMMLDGDPIPMPGRLYYRGIEINELISNHVQRHMFGFEEVCYLLLLGKLPTQQELNEFRAVLAEARHMPEGYNDAVLFKAPNPNIMNKLASGVMSMYSYDYNPESVTPENVLRQSIQLIARLPVIVSNTYNVKRHIFDHKSLYLHQPKDELSIAENMLRMIRADKKYTDEEAHLLDLCLTLHAEHGGGNNSTFTCRSLTSTGTDTYATISGAINAMKGPLHGGANAKVMQMLDNIKANVANPEDDAQLKDYLRKILDGSANDGSRKIYGLGHAVYTESDPREVLLKRYAAEMAPKVGMEADFVLMDKIERFGLELVMEKNREHRTMCANVDMYSGLVYRMLGIPDEMFTPLFAVARVSGWCAHRLEELISGGKLIRPGYKAVMPKDAHYIPIEDRT
ncbi:MAG: citrate synthase [Clostridia bacterium]|nr:citrate synthase [Clostridia bacterium]